jgi:hypothetical protein
MDKTHKVKLTPKWAAADDVYKGVVRIAQADRGSLKTGRLYKFKCTSGSGSFILRGLSPDQKGHIRLDQDTRDSLGISKGSPEVEFEIWKTNFADEVVWAWTSSDVGYRVATRLAIATFVLGLFLSPLVSLIHPISFIQWVCEKLRP